MSDVTDSSGLDPEILELQKRLYKEQLIRQASFKKGSKFYPVNIEPFALERDRLALPFTDGDRAARKQWLHDQVLSEREPVNIPEWSRVNIFRRAYRKPYDMLTSVVEPVLGPKYSQFFRWIFPKFIFAFSATCFVWYNLKYSPRNWEYGERGARIDLARKPNMFPGMPGFPDGIETPEFAMEDFEKRRAFLGDKLITSGP